jgi:hypothetical protein
MNRSYFQNNNNPSIAQEGIHEMFHASLQFAAKPGERDETHSTMLSACYISLQVAA